MSEARTAGGHIAEDAKVVGDKLGPSVEAASDKLADRAGAVARSAETGDLGAVADELKGAAGDIKSAAVEGGRALYETAKDQATGFVDQRKNDAAQSVADVAASLRDTGRAFEDRPSLQAFVGSAADGLEELAGSIRERSFAELFADAEDYARKSPATVAAVAIAAGFLLARFIKASSDEMSRPNGARTAARPASGRSARQRAPSAAA